MRETTVSKKKARKTALRRRNRAERPAPASAEYSREIVEALNRAGAPLTAAELAQRLEIKKRERPAFDQALAALERAGHVRAVLTQNIDTLHARAGSASVVELHGSIASFTCLACGAREALDAVLAQLRDREAPLCPACGTILKPGVVMFGELLPVDAFARAERLAREAGVMVVVGSSLQVWPVAGLPAETRSAGGALAVLNEEATPFDEEAALVVRARAGEVLAEVERRLREPSQERGDAAS